MSTGGKPRGIQAVLADLLNEFGYEIADYEAPWLRAEHPNHPSIAVDDEGRWYRMDMSDKPRGEGLRSLRAWLEAQPGAELDRRWRELGKIAESFGYDIVDASDDFDTWAHPQRSELLNLNYNGSWEAVFSQDQVADEYIDLPAVIAGPDPESLRLFLTARGAIRIDYGEGWRDWPQLENGERPAADPIEAEEAR